VKVTVIILTFVIKTLNESKWDPIKLKGKGKGHPITDQEGLVVE
jgi:hypothetical protein